MYKEICFMKKNEIEYFLFCVSIMVFLLISPRGLALQKQHKNMDGLLNVQTRKYE